MPIFKRLNVRRSPRFHFCLVAIAKDEAEYLNEWVAYHHLMGVEHFYIADNGSRDATPLVLERLAASGLVTFIDWPLQDRAQHRWYQHALAKFGGQSEFMGFLDIDEFLTAADGRQAVEQITDLMTPGDVGGLAINWQLFGSAGLEQRAPGLVIERFDMAARPERRINCHVKSVVRPSHVRRMTAHAAELTEGSRYLAGDGQEACFVNASSLSGRTTEVVASSLKVNHYIIKSRQEFIAKKMRRGRANLGPDHCRDLSYFHKHDFNDLRLPMPASLMEQVRRKVSLLSSEFELHS